MSQRVLELKDFAEVSAEVDRLYDGGYTRLGQWDLAQICDHLSYFIEGSLEGFNFRVPWLLKFFFGGMTLRKILKKRRFKPNTPTPQKPLPEPGGDDAAAVIRFKAMLTRLQAHTKEFHDSPFFGHLSPDQWREMHLIHCNHHLAYLSPKSNT